MYEILIHGISNELTKQRFRDLENEFLVAGRGEGWEKG